MIDGTQEIKATTATVVIKNSQERKQQYRIPTPPTVDFQVLAGQIPFHLEAKYELVYMTVSRLRKTIIKYGTIFHLTNYDKKINVWQVYSAETTESQLGPNCKSIIIYTDNSKFQ